MSLSWIRATVGQVKELRNAALEYADRGWYVLPLKPNGKAPIGALVPNGVHDATTDLATVLRWWTKVPDANIGLSCGRSGLIGIDVDPRHGGDESFHELEMQLGPLPPTVTAETGGGGSHYICQLPDCEIGGASAPGIDIQVSKYLVLPPSRHASGRQYVWEVPPDELEPAPLPESWIKRLRAVAGPPKATQATSKDPLLAIAAKDYFPALADRSVDRRGMAQCPFHKDGNERSPSLSVSGHLWSCYACPPPPNKQALGGNVYDLAGLLLGYPIPLRQSDIAEVHDFLAQRLVRFLSGARGKL